MKIDEHARIPSPLPAAAQADQTARARKASQTFAGSEAASAAAASTDRAEVSDTGRALQVAATALEQTPTIRADKVAELKARIKDGTYQVSGTDIAARMLTDDLAD